MWVNFHIFLFNTNYLFYSLLCNENFFLSASSTQKLKHMTTGENTKGVAGGLTVAVYSSTKKEAKRVYAYMAEC